MLNKLGILLFYVQAFQHAGVSQTSGNEMPGKGRPFEVGNLGGPGRPKGQVGGRRLFLQMLDKLTTKTLPIIEAEITALAEEKPLDFVATYVMPFIPKEFLIKHGGEIAAKMRLFFSNGKDGGEDDSSQGSD